MERRTPSSSSVILRIAVLAALVLAACDQAADQLLGPDGYRQSTSSSLFGRVTDPGGNGVSGATITILTAGTTTQVAQGTSDATGHYDIAVADGTYDVEVDKSGFGVRTLENIAVAGATELNVVLVQLIGVTGILRDDDGNKLSGQVVRFVGQASYSAQTDGNGAYSVTIPAGSYRIDVYRGTQLPTLPSSFSVQAYGFNFTSNATRDLTIPTRVVSVHVTDSESPANVVPNARVGHDCASGSFQLVSGHTTYSSFCWQTTTSASGDASFVGFPTTHQFRLRVFPPSGVALGSASTSIGPLTDALAVSVQLPPPSTFSGRVLSAGGTGVPSVQVRTYDSNFGYFYTSTNSSGEFSLAVSPSTYRIEIYGAPSGYPSFHLQAGTIDLSADASRDFTLAGVHTLTVKTTDADGNGVGSVRIANCLPISMSLNGTGQHYGNQCFNGSTDASGVWTSSAFGTSSNGTLTAIPPTGTPFGNTRFTVPAFSADHSVTVALSSLLTLSGTLTFDGTAYAHQRAQLSGNGANAFDTTDANGAFSVAAPPGSYSFYLQSLWPYSDQLPYGYWLYGYEWNGSYHQQFSLQSDEALDLDFPVHDLTVTVLDPDGNAVPGAFFNTNLNNTFIDLGSHRFYGGFYLRGYTDAQGLLTMPAFPTSGTFNITVHPPSGTDLVATTVQVPRITGDATLAIIMQPKNDPPVVTVDPASVTLDEGGSATFTGTAADPEGNPVTVSWTLPSGCAESDGTVSCTFADNGLFDVVLVADDGEGGLGTGVGTATVSNVAPTITGFTGPSEAGLGETITVSGSFSDPGADSWGWTVAWGDGSTSSGSGTPGAGIDASHAYSVGADYTVTLTVTDDDGGAASASLTIAVASNQPPTAAAGGPYVVDEGSILSLDGRGSSDPDAGDVLSYSWTISGGVTLFDAATAMPSTGALPDGPATYTATLTVADLAGAYDTDAATIEVRNVAPSVTAASAAITSGDGFSLTPSFTDPGADAWTYSVDWGNGTSSTGTLGSTGSFSVTGPTYYASGEYTVAVTVSDDDGGSDTEWVTLTVSRDQALIDVLPGSDENPFKLNERGNGTLPVAVLSTAGFDATTLDPATILLGTGTTTPSVPVEARPNGRLMASIEDVNGDGRPDLMLHFDRRSLITQHMSPRTTEMVLWGTTSGNIDVEGADVVRPIP